MSASGRHSLFSRGMNSIAMNRTPSAAITMPEMWRSATRWSPSQLPRPVAPIPSATNISVNEMQKMIAGPSTFARSRPSAMSVNATPEIALR
jgi:hypothetical protein